MTGLYTPNNINTICLFIDLFKLPLLISHLVHCTCSFWHYVFSGQRKYEISSGFIFCIDINKLCIIVNTYVALFFRNHTSPVLYIVKRRANIEFVYQPCVLGILLFHLAPWVGCFFSSLLQGGETAMVEKSWARNI